jgi:hypothetical protein
LYPPNCSPGPLRQFAKALIPGVQSTTGMVNASLPFIHQLRLLVQPSELGGLSTDLKHTIPSLTQLTKETIPLLRNQVRPLSSCVSNVIWPWSQLTLNDPHFNASNGFPPHKVYVEQADYLPGLAGESRDFDANGYYIRVLGSLGNSGVTSLQSGLIGGTLAPLVGEQPQPPAGGQRPPLAGGDIPNYACETQPPIQDLSAPASPAPTQYPLLGSLPQTLVQQLLHAIPPLPVSLSRDASFQKIMHSKYAPLSPAQRAADINWIRKHGLWEIFGSGPKGPTVKRTAHTSHRSTSAKPSQKR